MPLEYDDIPGSWAYKSEGWPETTDRAKEKYDYIVRNDRLVGGSIIPYGSYVLLTAGEYGYVVVDTLRIETEELLVKLNMSFERHKAIEILLKAAAGRKLTPAEIWDQRVSFVYGQLMNCRLETTKEQVRQRAIEFYGPRPAKETIR